MPRITTGFHWRAAAFVALVAASIVPFTSLAVEPEAGRFNDTWWRTDLLVANGEADRTWIWGPEANTFVQWEPYAEAPDGRRLVQYFDKGRMEDNSYRADAPWDVTMGLLVEEMMSGRTQIGDQAFGVGGIAWEINVAGDQGAFLSSPTYHSLSGLRIRVDNRTDSVVNETVNSLGEVSIDPALEARGTPMVHYDDITGHNVAAPFWEFMNSNGAVYLNGEAADAPLFPAPLYATGRPITEPYWVTIPVAGTEKDVLLQCFERRCLTYTPSNPEGWRVESGNVGAHYYEWRYAGLAGVSGRIAASISGNIWIMNGDGTNPRQVTTSDETDDQPLWSPDGTRLIFTRSYFDETLRAVLELWTVDASGHNERFLGVGSSHSYATPSFDWSPDGSQLVVSDGIQIYILDSVIGQTIQQYGDLGFVFDMDWPPSGSQILFKREASGEGEDPDSGIYILDTASGALTQVTEQGILDESPSWSPDGIKFVMSSTEDVSEDRLLYVLSVDGTDRQALAGTEGGQNPIWAPARGRIAYQTGDELWIVDVEGFTEPNPWLVMPAGDFVPLESFAWSSDSAALTVGVLDGGPSLYAVSVNGDIHNLIADGGQSPDWSP